MAFDQSCRKGNMKKRRKGVHSRPDEVALPYPAVQS